MNISHLKLFFISFAMVAGLFSTVAHAEKCSRIGHSEGVATFVITHEDTTHSVVTYSQGSETGRTSVGGGYSHQEVVEQYKGEEETAFEIPCP